MHDVMLLKRFGFQTHQAQNEIANSGGMKDERGGKFEEKSTHQVHFLLDTRAKKVGEENFFYILGLKNVSHFLLARCFKKKTRRFFSRAKAVAEAASESCGLSQGQKNPLLSSVDILVGKRERELSLYPKRCRCDPIFLQQMAFVVRSSKELFLCEKGGDQVSRLFCWVLL